MIIEPRPLTAERRADIEARHVDHFGCDSADLLAALLHAEQRIAELEAANERLCDRLEEAEARPAGCPFDCVECRAVLAGDLMI